MVYKCVVSFCKGNYEICPKVATFGFLNDEELKKLLFFGRSVFHLNNHRKVIFIADF